MPCAVLYTPHPSTAHHTNQKQNTHQPVYNLPSTSTYAIHQAGDATVAERGALYEGAVQVDERLGRVVGAIKVSVVMGWWRAYPSPISPTDDRFYQPITTTPTPPGALLPRGRRAGAAHERRRGRLPGMRTLDRRWVK